MGATLGHLIVYNYDVEAKDLTVAKDSIDFEGDPQERAWSKAKKNWPILEEKLTIRIVQILGVLEPEYRVFGDTKSQITDVHIETQERLLHERLAAQFPYMMTFRLAGKKKRVFINDFLRDPEESVLTHGKKLTTVPAGTKLICQSPDWIDLGNNNFFLETEAVHFAAEFVGTQVVVLEQDTEMVDCSNETWDDGKPILPGLVGYEPASFSQMHKLLRNSKRFNAKDVSGVTMDQMSPFGQFLLAAVHTQLVIGVFLFMITKDPSLETNLKPLMKKMKYKEPK